ncbi:hypothetical protein EUA02_18600 [Mycobacterium paragordonae]|nr:hypothetical protein EUA02_18600 [Mycobacterium paragordonae]TDL05395.1 hypothetical protein EUA05_19735 [Mycobacterium paragordonae]
MTRELPALINSTYHTNGRNAVGGLSSTGGTAIDYAVQAVGSSRPSPHTAGSPHRRTVLSKSR